MTYTPLPIALPRAGHLYRTTTIIVCLAFVIALPCAVHGQTTPQWAQEQLSAWYAAFNAGDAAAVASLYAPEAELLPPNKDPIRGREALEKAFAGDFRTTRFACSGDYDGFQIRGDLATGWGHDACTSTPHSGQASETTESRWLAVYRRHGNEWLIVYDTYEDVKQSHDTEAAVSLTGAEVWDRTIAYHDPENKWDDFAGAVRIVTAWADGTTLGLEYIELNNAADAYRGTRRVGDVVAVKGVENGECYRSVNGNKNPSDDEIESHLLSCEDALGFQQHHGAHVGFPMIARRAGLKAEGPVRREMLRGQPVLAVPLVGDSTTVRHLYWASRWTLYVDPDTHAMRGYRWESDEEPGQLWIAEGELDVNGIKMPQVKNVYLNEDGRLQFTDLFSHIGEWEQIK